MELFKSLLQREIFIGFAIAGAVVATIGSYMLNRPSGVNPRMSRFILRTGYAITWTSVAIFIAAGFMSNR